MRTISMRRSWSRPCLLQVAVLMGVIVIAALLPQPTSAENMQEAETIITSAASTWQNFMQDPDLSGFRAHVKEVKGVLIIPALLKGAFMFGVEGGNGVLLVRDEKTGTWSEPAFYELSSASFGLQAGAEKSEAVLVIQTIKGIESLLSSTIKLGADVSAAVGSQGGGMEGATSTNLGKDFVTYSRAKGAFAGASIDGASIRTRDDLNSVYYGSSVRPSDIVLVRNIKPNPRSKGLRDAVVAATTGK